MADPSFAGMEAEAETLTSGVNFRGTRAGKLNDEPLEQINQTETSPLLGPPILSDQTEKKWYNTPSVRSKIMILLICRCFGCYRRFY